MLASKATGGVSSDANLFGIGGASEAAFVFVVHFGRHGR